MELCIIDPIDSSSLKNASSTVQNSQLSEESDDFLTAPVPNTDIIDNEKSILTQSINLDNEKSILTQSINLENEKSIITPSINRRSARLKRSSTSVNDFGQFLRPSIPSVNVTPPGESNNRESILSGKIFKAVSTPDRLNKSMSADKSPSRSPAEDEPFLQRTSSHHAFKFNFFQFSFRKKKSRPQNNNNGVLITKNGQLSQKSSSIDSLSLHTVTLKNPSSIDNPVLRPDNILVEQEHNLATLAPRSETDLMSPDVNLAILAPRSETELVSPNINLATQAPPSDSTSETTIPLLSEMNNDGDQSEADLDFTMINNIDTTITNVAPSSDCTMFLPTELNQQRDGMIEDFETPAENGILRKKTGKKTKTSKNETLQHYNRLSLIGGLLPSSSSKKSSNHGDTLDILPQKDKKRGFFNQRAKSKEKRPHFWIKTTENNMESCYACSYGFSIDDAFQCNDCQVVVHNSCKEQLSKVRCAKLAKTKNGAPPLIIASQHLIKHDERSHSLPLLDESRLAENPDSANNDHLGKYTEDATSLPEHNIYYPEGFVAYTMPDPEWDKLDLWFEDQEPWSDTIDKELRKNLPAKELKRQNTIHDLYVTEKHHCQTLVVLKHTYFDGLALNSILPLDELHRLLPKLDDLLAVHLNFLRLLYETKRMATVVDVIHDVLLSQFTGDLAYEMIDGYVAFCSQKDAAVRMYNVMFKESTQFKNFITSLNSTSFYKALSLTDCLLKIAQRLSKYHQFVESLVKYTTHENSTRDGMLDAEKAVKNLITSVDTGIERIQMQELRLNIAHNMEPKSLCWFGKKVLFTPHDLISENRSLMHAADVQWFNAKRVSTDITLLLFSDHIVLMQKSSGGVYSFFSQDEKCSVASLKKMIVRDKAGKFGSDGVYLITTLPKPEMYEIKCRTKKANQALINRIQKAVERFQKQEAATPISELENELLPVSSITDEDLNHLHLLFATLQPINAKLVDYYQNLLATYGEIGNFARCIAEKITNPEDRDELLTAFQHDFDAQSQFMKNIDIAKAMGNLMSQSIDTMLTNGSQEMQYENGPIMEEPDYRLMSDTSATTNDVIKTTTTTSASDSQVGRSNTFHYVRTGEKRKGIKKHATVSGGTIPEMTIVNHQQIIKDDTSSSTEKESSTTSLSIEEDPSRCYSVGSLLQQASESQVAMNELHQHNMRLHFELIMLRDRVQHNPVPTVANNGTSPTVISHGLQRHSDNLATVEELRRLQSKLDEKRQSLSHMSDEKHFDLERREKVLLDRETRIERENEELHARWTHLYHTWEHQRQCGLPVPPLGPPPPPFAPNGPFPIIPHPVDVGVTPRRFSSRLPSFRMSPPYSMGAPPPPGIQRVPQDMPPILRHMARSASASDVPPTLRGSLLQFHGVASAPKTLLPAKLSQRPVIEEVQSSPIIGRRESKRVPQITEKAKKK